MKIPGTREFWREVDLAHISQTECPVLDSPLDLPSDEDIRACRHGRNVMMTWGGIEYTVRQEAKRDLGVGLGFYKNSLSWELTPGDLCFLPMAVLPMSYQPSSLSQTSITSLVTTLRTKFSLPEHLGATQTKSRPLKPYTNEKTTFYLISVYSHYMSIHFRKR